MFVIRGLTRRMKSAPSVVAAVERFLDLPGPACPTVRPLLSPGAGVRGRPSGPSSSELTCLSCAPTRVTQGRSQPVFNC